MPPSDIVAALKKSAGFRPSLSLVVHHPAFAILRPVATEPDRIDMADVERLTIWRNKHQRSFLTEFEATSMRTREWLVSQVRTNSSKILFMVDDTQGRTIGYMGLDCINWSAGYGEADAIVRGTDAPRGFMRSALIGLLSWARQCLCLNEIGVRVLSDNPAVRFYEGIGFRTQHSVPLRMKPMENGRCWFEDPSYGQAQRHLLHMRLVADSG